MKENLTRRLSRILFRLMAYRPPRILVPPQGVVLTDVTIVNPGCGRQERQTLVVEGDRIRRISSGGAQGSAGQADGPYAGSYVLPGLIDMHVHIAPSIRELVNLLFLAHGVTTVREAGDADGTTWRGRQRIQAGEIPGPRIFASGPVLDGDPPFLATSWVIRDAAAAQDAVATLAALGADFVKIHHKLSAGALRGIGEAAAERGLRVVGHIPVEVPLAQASVWDVQHLDGLVPYPGPGEGPLEYQKRWRDLDSAQIDAYVGISVERGLVHTPTLVSGSSLLRLAEPDPPTEPAAQFLPRYFAQVIWNRESMPLFRRFSDEALALMQQGMARTLEVTGRLHQAGVCLHLGTDTVGMPYVVPGASLQQELKLMAEAGLTLEQAWTAGTHAAGESLGLPLLGAVQEGAPADLLIFAQDPSRDLAALSTLQGVVAQGRLYPKEDLDQALLLHRQRFERPLYDRLSAALIRLLTRVVAIGS